MRRPTSDLRAVLHDAGKMQAETAEAAGDQHGASIEVE
jgi:hypothetical protein